MKNKGESDNQCRCPHHKQEDQRKRSKEAKGCLALLGITHEVCAVGPRRPGNDIEESRQAETAGCTARQNNRLKGIKQRDKEERNPRQQTQDMRHGSPWGEN